ncbi:MAG: hypothetical protein JXL81_04590 [Deltaproteobacteria bacterium]|nr:hypothetical protein [Deltaproteobacteria bacterium]
MEIEKFKPAVKKNILLFIAGVVWEGVGFMLLYLAFSWLYRASGIRIYPYIIAGILLALLVHHFGFLKIVDKNLNRILEMDLKKRCLFSFIPSRSYLVIVVMIIIGAFLRHSMIPKYDLAIIYIGIGLALVLSSVRYIRVFYKEAIKPKI